MQCQAVFGLQVNDEFVHAAGGCLKNGMRCGPKIDFNVAFARCQAFSGSNVEGHAGPPPVGNFSSQCDKSFGAAVGVDTGFFVVARNCLTIQIACTVLTAYNVLIECFCGPWFESSQNFELLIANGIGMCIDGRLHGNGTQQLQRMVLHHVAQCSRFFIKRTAFFNAEFFCNRDLNVGNVFAAPKRFEQSIAKAQGKQVLHRRLAQVMVDPKNLVFTKNLAHTLVDGLVGLEVVAQRFFQHDASFGGVEFGDGKLLADRVEQAGCRGQVHHHVVCFAFGQSRRQFGVVVWIGQI